MDVRAFGLLRMDAGQPGGARARVVAGAIAQRAAAVLHQVAEHQHLVAERLRAASWSEAISKPVPVFAGSQPFWMMPFGT